jgi:enoyl-CoA hydratase/carnithine racemase
MEFKTLLVNNADSITTITLNRPSRMNAFNRQMEIELAQVLDDVSRDKMVRVLIVTGAGRAFCSGGDVSENMAQEYGGK